MRLLWFPVSGERGKVGGRKGRGRQTAINGGGEFGYALKAALQNQ